MIYKANKTMQLLGMQSPAKYAASEEVHKGFLDILKAHTERGKLDIYNIALDSFLYGVITGKREARRKSKANNKRIIARLGEATILDNEQIRELVSTWEAPQDLFEVVTNHLEEAITESKQANVRIDKVQYMLDDTYKIGVASALYMMNETYKEVIATLEEKI